MLKTGNGSFRPRVVSALSRFGPESFRPGSIRPWVVSAQFGGSFRPILAHLSRSLIGELIVYEGIIRPSVCQHFQTTSPLKP